jgi:DNA helicase-2/ATP-dependent DNA helicase PcrA
VNAREAFVRRKRDRKSVLIECAANAKGKEFDHVILPFLQDGEFHPLQPGARKKTCSTWPPPAPARA